MGILSIDMPGAQSLCKSDDDLDSTGDGGDLDKPNSEKPNVRIYAGREAKIRERGVHEPAAIGRYAKEQREEERQAAERVDPQRIGAQPGKRKLAGAEDIRHKKIPKASTIGTANRNIIIVPCIVKSWL